MEAEMVDMEAQTQNKEEERSISIFKNANRPVTLKFEDVVYTVKIKKQQGLIPKSNKKCEEKTILKGISGIALPGEMLAMLGPSGSGKTTLLTALGGRLSGRIGGTISYNGKPFTNIMKRNTGFVTQDDILYPHLTVTETLVFTALLRLPNTLSKAEKIEHVEAVISQLGLTRCKDSIIGGAFLRGVSGGERKRVSIGQEMLINPSLILLDEPTSGLDSTTAQRIVALLRELTNGGRTIVMTIHQPSSRLFYMFHKVLLLSEGNPLYFGKAEVALDYFSTVGYAPSVAMNPSDFMLDLSNGISSDESHEDPAMVKQKLLSAYKANIAPNSTAELEEHGGNIQEIPNDKQFPRWTITWWQQFSVLLQRGLKQRKHESFSGNKIGQVVVVAFLSGLLWWKSSSLQDQIGLLFFYTGFWGFFPLFQALFTFPQERRMLEKERSSGMYRLSSYFMAQIIGDLPMELILPTVFVTITYWMAGLKRTSGHFILTLLVLLFSVLISQGLGLAIGAVFLNLKVAATFSTVIMLAFQLAGGFFVQHVPPVISWIKYVSISQYTYKLMLGTQYERGETYHCASSKSGICLVEDFPSIKVVGLGGQVVSVMALLIMLVGYRVIAYVALMRIGVTKK